jgi:hypothetical protein
MSPYRDLKRPSTISVFHRLLKRSIQHNTILTVQYIDNGTLVPAELNEERKALLAMEKAMNSLQLFREWAYERARGMIKRLNLDTIPYRAVLPTSNVERFHMIPDAFFDPND